MAMPHKCVTPAGQGERKAPKRAALGRVWYRQADRVQRTFLPFKTHFQSQNIKITGKAGSVVVSSEEEVR